MKNEGTLRLFLKLMEDMDVKLQHRLVQVFLALSTDRFNLTMLAQVGMMEYLVHVFQRHLRSPNGGDLAGDVLRLIQQIGSLSMTGGGLRKFLSLMKDDNQDINLLRALVRMSSQDAAAFIDVCDLCHRFCFFGFHFFCSILIHLFPMCSLDQRIRSLCLISDHIPGLHATAIH